MSIDPNQINPPPVPPDEPMPEPQVTSNEFQGAKWFSIAFMIAIAVLMIFAIIFWISFVRTNVFGTH
jgi:hypothetical protein